MATENTSPRRSGADWFGLAAFAVLLISSTVLVIRLISTRFLSTGHLLLASGALLVLSGLHGWVQLPRRNKTGGRSGQHGLPTRSSNNQNCAHMFCRCIVCFLFHNQLAGNEHRRRNSFRLTACAFHICSL